MRCRNAGRKKKNSMKMFPVSEKTSRLKKQTLKALDSRIAQLADKLEYDDEAAAQGVIDDMISRRGKLTEREKAAKKDLEAHKNKIAGLRRRRYP